MARWLSRGREVFPLPLYSTTPGGKFLGRDAAAAAGIAARLWSPGDVKELTISGTAGLLTVTDLTIGAIILGFDHNAALEGSGRIHFQLARLGVTPVALVDKRHGSFSDLAGAFTMNTTATSEGGWQGLPYAAGDPGSDSSDVLAPREGTLLALLPEELRAVMKPCTKYTDNTGNSMEAAAVTATQEWLFLPRSGSTMGPAPWPMRESRASSSSMPTMQPAAAQPKCATTAPQLRPGLVPQPGGGVGRLLPCEQGRHCLP